MSDRITGNNTGVGNATDGNGGNNTNTDQTGQTQGGGAGAPSGGNSTPQGPKNWADEDKKNREKLKTNQFGKDTVEWYQTILNAFSYDIIKNSKTSDPNKDVQKIKEDAKNESLIKLQEMSFILTLAMSKAASSAVDTALKAADKRYKKK